MSTNHLLVTQKPNTPICDIYRGYNIGVRLIDEFLAKSGVGNCANFRETADVIAKVRTQISHLLFR